MRILVTGAEGFIARNLIVRLGESPDFAVLPFSRKTPEDGLAALVAEADAVVHLAGVNRPPSVEDFVAGNVGLTERLCEALAASGRAIPVIFSSSSQAALDNPYGRSKRAAEDLLQGYAAATGAPVQVYRLPNVFGKWCRPNYNSVVATFCHKLARGLPIRVDDPAASLSLVHVDDVVEAFIRVLWERPATAPGVVATVEPAYGLTVGELAAQLTAFRDSRESLVTERVGAGLVRALYATYVSYLPPEAFAYPVPRHADPRGVFVEMLKTKDSGQFSVFTAHPGVTRGGHYHHSKTEKFLVIQGRARFGFRHILSDERREILVSGDAPQIVETIPGWAHDITNVGEGEMVVLLWANEIFDRARPDTIACRV